MLYCTVVWNRLTHVRIVICVVSVQWCHIYKKWLHAFCHEVVSVFVCDRAGPWWHYRGPSTEEIRLHHPSDACPPAAMRERQKTYQHNNKPNFSEVYHSYPHSLCNHGLLPITNTVHYNHLIMKLHNRGKRVHLQNSHCPVSYTADYSACYPPELNIQSKYIQACSMKPPSIPT